MQAFRIRVSKSEIGSVIIGVEYQLPAALSNTGYRTLHRKLPKANTTNVKLPHIPMAPTATPTTPHFSSRKFRFAF